MRTIEIQDDDYEHVVYKVGWAAQVLVVDQYGCTDHTKAPLYEKKFPTRNEALAHLESITLPSTNPNTRIWPPAPHSYYQADVHWFKEEVARLKHKEIQNDK